MAGGERLPVLPLTGSQLARARAERADVVQGRQDRVVEEVFDLVDLCESALGGEIQRAPSPVPKRISPPKSFSAFPASRNTAADHFSRIRYSNSALPTSRLFPPVT